MRLLSCHINEMIKHLQDHGQYPEYPDLSTGSADLEKTEKGTVSYVPENHEMMVNLQGRKSCKGCR